MSYQEYTARDSPPFETQAGRASDNHPGEQEGGALEKGDCSVVEHGLALLFTYAYALYLYASISSAMQ